MFKVWIFNFYFLFTFFDLTKSFLCPQLNSTQTPKNNLDEITDKLPGLNFKLNFKHYSGYLQVSDTRFLHYVLVTAKSNPDKAPVVFWFNGGPGASSLLGLFFESGPYLVSNDGTRLVENVHSWNKYAHKVFLETPAGTGFSYVTDGNYTNNDDQV
uniref:Serine carboxypeptidase n=1 Tax=Meloidogyne incognita TaxID=6306 RepID=A0A914KUT6_MELIC